MLTERAWSGATKGVLLIAQARAEMQRHAVPYGRNAAERQQTGRGARAVVARARRRQRYEETSVPARREGGARVTGECACSNKVSGGRAQEVRTAQATSARPASSPGDRAVALAPALAGSGVPPGQSESWRGAWMIAIHRHHPPRRPPARGDY